MSAKSVLNALTTTIAFIAAFSASKNAYADDETHWTDGGVERVVRTWTAAEVGAVTNSANWNGEGEILPTDYLLINNGGTATIDVGEAVSAGWLYVGRGWKFVDGAWKDSTDYDTGAAVNMTGGELVVGNELYVGSGYSDYYDSIFTASGDASVFAYDLMMGNFASKTGGAQDHAKVARLLLGGHADVLAHRLHIGTWHESSNEVVIAENATLTVTNAFELGSSGHTVYTQNGGTVSVRTGKSSWGGDMDVKFGNGGTLSATIDGGTFRFSNALAVGNGGSTTLALTGGTIQAVEEDSGKRQVFVGLGSSGTAEVILDQGGTLSAGSIHVGRDGGTGTLVLNGGNLALNAPDWWGSLNVGWGDNSKGTVRVERGTYACSGYTCVGRSNSSLGIFEMRGGVFNVDAYMGVGHDANSTGVVVVAGGNLNVSNLSVGHEKSAAVGRVTVNGGELRSYNDIYLGNNGEGSLTINGGRVVCANVNQETGNPVDRWLKFNNSASSDFAGTSVLNLNGGTLAVSSIAYGDNASAKGVVNFNGGRLQTYPKSWKSDMIQHSDRLTVNVLGGGAVFDTNGYDDMTLPVDLNGDGGDSAGGIVKAGEGKLTISGSIGIKGYIKVEAGTLQINSSVGELDKIEVAAGATLLLNGATVRSVRTLVKNGTIKDAASDADEVEISATNKKLASAVWTGAVDADLDNPLNWKVYDEDGVRVSADELPTSDCVVQVHYSTNMPDFSGLNVKSIAMVVSGTVAPCGNWTVPAVVKDAIVWYDYSDESAIQLDGNNEVYGILNKAENGSDLDAVIFNGNSETASTAPTYGTETLNGRKVMTFANSKGFVSKNAPGLKSTDARTLISLGRRDVPQEGVSKLFSIGFARDAEYSMNGVFSINRWDYGQHFRYYDSTVEGYWNAAMTPGADPSDLAISYMDFDGDKTVRAWVYSESVGETVKQTAAIAAEGTLDANGTELLYMGYRRQSQAASTGILAEQLVFTNVLTDAELTAVSDYLKAKWYTVPEVDMASLPANIVFEGENAVYNLGGGDWTFADVAGSGAISNANITVTGTLTVVVNDDGTIDPLEIDGKLTLGENARLVVKGARKLTFATVEAIAATGGVSGTFASVVSETGKPLKVAYEAGLVKVAKRGGMSICLQ